MRPRRNPWRSLPEPEAIRPPSVYARALLPDGADVRGCRATARPVGGRGAMRLRGLRGRLRPAGRWADPLDAEVGDGVCVCREVGRARRRRLRRYGGPQVREEALEPAWRGHGEDASAW